MNPPSGRELLVTPALLRRLSSVHVNHKRIASSALLIAVLTLVAKLFVAGREIAIAWRYGVSTQADAYQLSFTIVTWLPMFLAGAMAVVLVPRLVKVRSGARSAGDFVREANGTALLLGVVVCVGTFLLAPLAAKLLASHLESSTLELTTMMSRQMAPVAFSVTIAGYLTARLQARERFSYTITEAVPALIIALLVAGPIALTGVAPLIVGTDVGFAVQLVLLAMLVAHGDPPLGGVRIRHSSAEWGTLYGATLMMAFAQLLITAAVPIDQAFASRIAEGAVATLGYASRILVLLTGLATVVIGRALLPVLSRAVASGDLALGHRQSVQWAMLMFVAGVLGTLSLWLLASDLVRLLFERGAFGASATADVSAAVRYGAFQLPFYFAGIVLVQWYAANGRFREILAVTAVALLVKVIANAVLTPPLGVRGIMLSTALMYVATSSLLALMLGRAASDRTVRAS